MDYTVNLVIPSTGDPNIIDPLFKSIIQNTVGKYSVVVLKQETAHPKAEETYEKWQKKCPDWRFLWGTERMSLSARNIGLMESYVERHTKGAEQWFAEMDDDVILPPRWDEDMVRAAQAIGEGEIFVPLLTFWAPIYYSSQVAILSPEIWRALYDADVKKLNQFYLEEFRVEDPRFVRCRGPELSFLMRRNRSLMPLLWDTAFDIQRHCAGSNEDIMLTLKKYGWSAWVVQSVLVFHRGMSVGRKHPKQGYARAALIKYLSQKWPNYDPEQFRAVLKSAGGNVKIADAERNMPKGLPKDARPCSWLFETGGKVA